MKQVFVGDSLLDLAKAKVLASVMGGSWHGEQDVESDSEQKGGLSSKAEEAPPSPAKPNTSEGYLSRTLYRKNPGNDNSSSVAKGGISHKPCARKGCGRPARRPADGRAPGRQDPKAVARMEAEAKLAAARVEKEGTDRTWLLPTNVDYYTDRAALLRELVKEMPSDKRLSFQTRVANASTKEAVEGVLHDYAPKLECLVLPHARSREVDLLQVKKDTARERVVLDGKEVPKQDPSDHTHAWHDELWATVEKRIMEDLLEIESRLAGAEGSGRATSDSDSKRASALESQERALSNEQWNKARAVATTSEVFKAMSRTGAGGDAYFALVALFCTADKLVVPVACQESPIEVDFFCHHQQQQQKGWTKNSPKPKGRESSVGGAGRTEAGGVHVMVTIPSTFDIYLRDGQVKKGASAGSGGRNGGAGDLGRGGSGKGGGSNKKNSGDATTDVSVALHLVRVRAVVEEEICVVGLDKRSPPEASFPALSSMADSRSDGTSSSQSTFAGSPAVSVDRGAGRIPSNVNQGLSEGRHANPGRKASDGSSSETSETPAPAFPALTRTERRMRVTLVPEPSVVGEMVRNFSRTFGVEVSDPEPPRVLGS